jgi:hypothetical protein
MTTVKAVFVNQTGGEPIEREYKCVDKLSPPTMPMWAIKQIDGKVILLNLPMVLWLEMEESVIKMPDKKDFLAP